MCGEFKKIDGYPGYIWSEAELTKKKTLPVYEYDAGIDEMLEESLRLCPNDDLLRSFEQFFDDKGYLTERQYASLKRFYDTWGGNILP